MRIDKVASIVSGSQLNGQVGRGHVNSLVIYASHKDFNITVRLRDETGSDVLIPNIPFKYLDVVSNYSHGAASDPKAADDAVKGHRFKADLGSIHLSQGDELSFEIVSTGVAGRVSVYTLSDNLAPQQTIQYELVNDSNVVFNKAQSVFAFHTGPTATGANGPNDLDDYLVDYKITDSEGTIFTDHIGAYSASALIGRYETAPDTRDVIIWANNKPTPETVQIVLSGADTSKVTLLVIRQNI